MELKLLNVVRVFHVGSLDRSKKTKGSYEGSGLSVSNCPDAWREINKGATHGAVWNIKKKKGGFFVDYYNTINDEVKKDLSLWGIINGFIEYCSVYSVEYYDDEREDFMVANFLDEREAEMEADMCGYEVIKSWGFKAKSKMLKRLEYHLESAEINCYDLLMTLFVEDNFKNIDGIWWDDTYAPEIYSAPRGVIFNFKLGEWDFFIGEDKTFETGCQDIMDFEEDYYN